VYVFSIGLMLMMAVGMHCGQYKRLYSGYYLYVFSMVDADDCSENA
jgi:hypothetical protein